MEHIENKQDKNKARFTHDCNTCIFLGRFGAFDLYFCQSSRGIMASTVIARFGNEGSEYASGIEIMYNSALNEAKRRATYELGVDFGKYTPWPLEKLIKKLERYSINQVKLLHERTKKIIYIGVSSSSGFRERLYLAGFIAKKEGEEDHLNNNYNASYDPHLDQWNVKHLKKIAVKVKTEASASRKLLKDAGFIFIDAKELMA